MRLGRVARGVLSRFGYDVVNFNRYPAGRGGVRPVHIREAHHHWYGQPWAAGRGVFDVLRASGLTPQHRVLDFGCGTLRAGVWAIAYLDPDRYFGIDAHWASLEAAALYEIPLHGLESKRPRLLYDNRFSVSHFGVRFDRILASSIFFHFTPEQCRTAYTALRAVAAPGCKLLISHSLGLPTEEIAELGFHLVSGKMVDNPLLDAPKMWCEFVPDEQPVSSSD